VPHVLIAGAGLAGLAAARELQRRKYRVTVIEASHRVGGRVWTIRDGFAHRQHAEGGGDLIESNQKAVVALARELKLPLVRTIRRGFGFYGADNRGRVRAQPMSLSFRELMTALAPLIHDYRLAEKRWDSGVAQAMAHMSVAAWLDEIRAGRGLRSRLKGFRGFFLADPEDLSLLALIDFFGDDGFGDTETFRIRTGNDRLPDALARGLREPVQLDSILRRVRQTDSGIVASIETQAGRHDLQADFAIVAIPATLARDVVFEPGLRPSQHDAIAHLRYGHVTRLLLQFDGRFWRRRGRPDLFGSDQSIGAFWDGNEQQPHKAGILSFLAGGGASQELQQILKTEGTSGVTSRVSWLGRPGRLLASREIVWENEPWSRGGYAVFDPSFNPEWRAELARPHGRVLFAGEHTHLRFQGYMEGAVLSGQRAAAEVLSVVNG
jgi:monoamine oxidase